MFIITRYAIRKWCFLLKQDPATAFDGGPLQAAWMHLATGFTRPPDDQTVWADVIEAAYPGYAVNLAAWIFGPFDTTRGVADVSEAQLTRPTDDTVPTIVVAAVYTDDEAGGNVLGVDVLDPSVALADSNSGFGLAPVLDVDWDVRGVPATVIR